MPPCQWRSVHLVRGRSPTPTPPSTDSNHLSASFLGFYRIKASTYFKAALQAIHALLTEFHCTLHDRARMWTTWVPTHWLPQNIWTLAGSYWRFVFQNCWRFRIFLFESHGLKITLNDNGSMFYRRNAHGGNTEYEILYLTTFMKRDKVPCIQREIIQLNSIGERRKSTEGGKRRSVWDCSLAPWYNWFQSKPFPTAIHPIPICVRRLIPSLVPNSLCHGSGLPLFKRGLSCI